MRKKRTLQASIFHCYSDHQIGRELRAMSDLLDLHRDLIDSVHADTVHVDTRQTGCRGMSAESILRCALLKQYRQLSYEELAFHLLDSSSFNCFARLDPLWVPKKSALQSAISSISPATWEHINQRFVSEALTLKVENGQVIRIDSTVTDSPIHAPTDSSLLSDSVRVMVRLLRRADELLGASKGQWRNHSRVVRKRARQIQYGRGAEKRQRWYCDMLQFTTATASYLEQASAALKDSGVDPIALIAWQAEMEHYQPLIAQVIDQTRRRVIDGEQVPVAEKLFSLFEAHTDLIKKDRRDIQYGHKLNLVSGRSGLILDVVIESGNPADSARFGPMIERQSELYGRAPRQVAADGGYASVANLDAAKAMGVTDVAFHKKRGLSVEKMVKSHWVYRKLRNFRAGIEANISCLKRAYGLDRCTWKGLAHFNAYVWSSVVAYNLALLSRLTLAPP